MIQIEKVEAGTTLAAVTKSIGSTLPGMVQAAAQKLAAAADAAEVLDARDAARLTYTTAQMAGRIAKAKGAHDTLVAAAHRAQADALDIEAAAKRRLADEYDAAQPVETKKGGRPKTVPNQNGFTAAEAGLTRKDVFDARRVRNAEQAQPGVVREALDKALDEGREPSRAVVNEAIAEALGEEKPQPQPRNLFDELVALWKEADAGVRQDFKAYIKGSELVAKINHSAPVTPEAAEQTGAVPVIPAAPVAPLKALSKADQIRLLRPHCQHPGTDLCGGSGRNHCHACKKLMAEGETA